MEHIALEASSGPSRPAHAVRIGALVSAGILAVVLSARQQLHTFGSVATPLSVEQPLLLVDASLNSSSWDLALNVSKLDFTVDPGSIGKNAW